MICFAGLKRPGKEYCAGCLIVQLSLAGSRFQ